MERNIVEVLTEHVDTDSTIFVRKKKGTWKPEVLKTSGIETSTVITLAQALAGELRGMYEINSTPPEEQWRITDEVLAMVTAAVRRRI